MENPKVTIAVAIYNLPNEFLNQCINSLIHQSLEDIEILLISDNSNLELITEYEKQDNRIRVIHNKTNRGLARARNQSIEEAQGEYLCFVDGDDWIDLDICKKAYEKAKEYSADVVLWTYTTSLDGINTHTNYRGPSECAYTTPEELMWLRTQILDPTFAPKQQIPMAVTAWAKLYKMDFLRANADVRFPEYLRKGGEDYLFNYKLFGRLQRACFIEDYGYYYRQFSDSFTKRFRADEWDNRMTWITEVRKNVMIDDDIERIVFKRFCLNEVIAQCTVTQFHPDAHLTYRDRRNEIKRIRHIDVIEKALQELKSLQLKKNKYLFMKLYKYKCFDIVLLLSKIYHEKNKCGIVYGQE